MISKPGLRATGRAEAAQEISAWRELLARAPKFDLPDPLVADAYFAGLADIFVMREQQIDGSMAGVAGTEMYRAMNTGEPCLAAMILDQAGFHFESRAGLNPILTFQEKNGRWDDQRRWGHDMAWLPAFRCWALREHYLFTHDRQYLSDGFHRMLAHVRWADGQRQKTKITRNDGSKSIAWGLMPRGMGDGGLMDGDDMFGVFFPTNIFNCFLIQIALWTAKELDMREVISELTGYYDDALACLNDALERGAIEEDGFRWIPGAPRKTSGSRFGVVNAIAPCKVIPPHHPLAEGTLTKLERHLSESGLPIGLGWQEDGLWVAMALDSLTYAHLERDEADAAAAYLYPHPESRDTVVFLVRRTLTRARHAGNQWGSAAYLDTAGGFALHPRHAGDGGGWCATHYTSHSEAMAGIRKNNPRDKRANTLGKC